MPALCLCVHRFDWSIVVVVVVVVAGSGGGGESVVLVEQRHNTAGRSDTHGPFRATVYRAGPIAANEVRRQGQG